MAPQIYPLFSDYQALRRTNPNSYWSTKTQTEMTRAYKLHGMSFFDVHKEET